MTKDFSLLRPFDLEAAKAGEPICTRDGQKVRFIAHVPEADEAYRVVVMLENASFPTRRFESGSLWVGITNNRIDLCMAPLCWVEGRPVYSGDILYFTDVEGSGEVYGVNDKNQLLIRSSKFGCVHQEADKLTWTPPTVESLQEKLAQIIAWHVAVATDPAVNGGFKLVPVCCACDKKKEGE